MLVLTVDEESVARTFQRQLSDDNNELKLDDAAKIVGCWNGLAKRGQAEHSFEPDTAPDAPGVAFAGNIKDSKRVEELFHRVTDYYVAATEPGGRTASSPLKCSVQHVDGTFNALERNTQARLAAGGAGRGHLPHPHQRPLPVRGRRRARTRRGDVPVAAQVGRRHRPVRRPRHAPDKTSGKQFGYIILPIGIPAGMTPEEALRDNKRYAAVWEVLQALRAHDERFDAMVNRIELTTSPRRQDQRHRRRRRRRRRGGAGRARRSPSRTSTSGATRSTPRSSHKVGSREYWTDWAKDVADIAERQTTRITRAARATRAPACASEFDDFLDGLRGNLNEGITENDAIEMLAQHLITRPVFDALFDGDEFLDNNPVAQTMERMLAALDQHDLEDENRDAGEVLRLGPDARSPASTTARAASELIAELYDTFFSTAFKKTVDKLGIVYTPVEIVDFILRSADEVLRQEFGQGLTDEGVHILDGFTGTGTFMVRLLQLGLIEPHDLARKYAEELHANEILLLAYYIAAVNIETTYYDVMPRRRRDGEPRRRLRVRRFPA